MADLGTNVVVLQDEDMNFQLASFLNLGSAVVIAAFDYAETPPPSIEQWSTS